LRKNNAGQKKYNRCLQFMRPQNQKNKKVFRAFSDFQISDQNTKKPPHKCRGFLPKVYDHIFGYGRKYQR